MSNRAGRSEVRLSIADSQPARLASLHISLDLTIMNMTISLVPFVSLVAGILILIVPRLLNFIVAIYLIAIGLVGLFGGGHFLR